MIVIDILAAIWFIDLADGFTWFMDTIPLFFLGNPSPGWVTGLMGNFFRSLVIGYSWSKMFISRKWYACDLLFFIFCKSSLTAKSWKPWFYRYRFCYAMLVLLWIDIMNELNEKNDVITCCFCHLLNSQISTNS